MRVLQILPEINVGGVETGTVDFAKYLVNHGHHSVVISNGGDLLPELESSGTKHYTLPVHKKSIPTMIRMIRSVREIIRKEKIEIVHARSRVPAWIAFFSCRKTEASFITTCHGYYKSFFSSQVMGWSKYIIVPSQVIGKHMINTFKVSSGSIRCIPRSVNLEKFSVKRQKHSGKSSCTIAIVGRITPLKGHIYFIRAMAKVIRNIPYAQIWIIGDAPEKKQAYKHEIEILINRLGLKGNIKFLGNRSDVPELLSKVDVLVMSSIYPESFGRVILEAQAAGVPVVATKIGGSLDIIEEEKTGLLVLPKDTDAMAKAVLRILKDKEFEDRIVKEARKKLEYKFTLEKMASKTIEVYEELLNSMNILVIKISSIGDVILITASLKALRKKFPKANIYCLVGKESCEILNNCPYLNGIIVYDPKHKDKGFYRFYKFSRKLRKYKFDKIIDFQNNRKSHLLSFLSFAKDTYGYKNNKFGFLLSNSLKYENIPISPVEHQFKVLELLGIKYQDNLTLELWPSKKDTIHAKNLLDSEWLGNAKNIVGINISASEKWKTKNWPIEHIAKLCDILSKNNIRVIITGTDRDKSIANNLYFLVKSKPANFVGRTDIMQLAALIKRCKVFITPDSAPMHIAAAVQVPIIAFFGPTDSNRHVPPAKKVVIMDRKLECAPCYSTRCKILTHACMNDITPEEVAKEVEELLETKK